MPWEAEQESSGKGLKLTAQKGIDGRMALGQEDLF